MAFPPPSPGWKPRTRAGRNLRASQCGQRTHARQRPHAVRTRRQGRPGATPETSDSPGARLGAVDVRLRPAALLPAVAGAAVVPAGGPIRGGVQTRLAVACVGEQRRASSSISLSCDNVDLQRRCPCSVWGDRKPVSPRFLSWSPRGARCVIHRSPIAGAVVAGRAGAGRRRVAGRS